MPEVSLVIRGARVVSQEELGEPYANVASQNGVMVELADGTRIGMTRARFEALFPNATLDGEAGAYPTWPTYTIVPDDEATGVAVGANIVMTFDSPMDDASIDNTTTYVATAAAPSTPIAATVTLGGDDFVVTINPSSNLAAATAHVAVCEATVRSAAGNPVRERRVTTFTTA